MTDRSIPDYSNLKPGQTFEAQGPYIHARHGSVGKSRTIVRRSSWQVPPGLGILSVGRPVITATKRASLEVIVTQAGSVVYDNSLKVSIDKAAKDLMGKLSAGKIAGDAAGAYNSFNAKLDAVHRLAASTHGGIELVAKLRPKKRFPDGGGGAWITAYVDVVFVVLPSENTFERVLTILNRGLSSDYQGDVIDLFKEATKVFGFSSAVSDEDDDEDEDDEIVELDEDDDEDSDEDPKQDEDGEGDKGPDS